MCPFRGPRNGSFAKLAPKTADPNVLPKERSQRAFACLVLAQCRRHLGTCGCLLPREHRTWHALADTSESGPNRTSHDLDEEAGRDPQSFQDGNRSRDNAAH
jgi:hypothetical protein